MNSRTGNRVRGTTWAFVALTLILFCWLGFVIAKVSNIFDELKPPLPVAMKLVITYGSLGLPSFGVIAGCLMIFSDLFLPLRWLPTLLTGVSIIVALIAFQVFTTPICVLR